MKSDPFFEELRDWSQIKLTINRKYLKPYCFKLGSWSHEICYVDGFAGKGIYGNGLKGSPFVAADLAREFKKEGRLFSLKCLNVEKNSSHFIDLCSNTEELKSEIEIVNLKGNFCDHVPAIIHELGNCPTLFFIDPYGLAPIKFKDLEPIFKRSASTEIIMNFSRKGLQRLAGNLSAETTSDKGKRTAKTKVRTLTEVLNTDEWIAIWLGEYDSLKRDQDILELYTKQLVKYFEYVCAVPIRPGYESSPRYFIIYATRKYDGVDLMNDFIFDIEISLFDKRYPLFSPLDKKELEKALTQLQMEICAFGKERGQTTLREIRESLLPGNFAIFKRKHYHWQVKELWQAGKIRKAGDKAIVDRDILRFV